jgi:cyclic beta-1,2-glucan synthetase
VDPCIPSSWPEYQIAWRYLDSRYTITVSNPARRCRGVATATLDGAPVDAAAIPLVNDGLTHDVQIVLGDVTARPPILNRRAAGVSTVLAESTR